MGELQPPTDINHVRNLFYQAQRNKVQYPADPINQVSVDKNARIQTGKASTPTNPISKVQHGTWAATRLDQEWETVRYKMPDTTERLDGGGGYQGWTYTFTTEMSGLEFSMFAYYDGSSYQVMLLSPEIEGKYNAHNAHLYSDGRLCLSPDRGSGQPTLEEAYSKSVLWANGMDVHMAGYAFPFSVNNV